MTTVGIHQPQYLPWLGLIDRASRCDVFVVLDSVSYSKNYFYNRNRIKTANGPIWLTVPILTKGHSQQAFVNARIDNTQKWAKKHWKSIYYSYHKAEFFNEYQGFFKSTLSSEWELLIDLCMETFEFLLDAFGVETKIIRSSELDIEGKKEALLIDICRVLRASKYLSGPDGKNYIDLELWKQNRIEVDFQQYMHPSYPQMFDGFDANLSSIDLLFNCGKNGLRIINSGQQKYFQNLNDER